MVSAGGAGASALCEGGQGAAAGGVVDHAADVLCAAVGHVHSVCTSAASVADCHMLPELLHGEDRKVWGDGGYQGQTEGIKEAAPKAQDMTCKRTRFKNYVDENQRKNNRSKSSVRAKVEHVFRILKRVFGFDKVQYRGIAKNHHRLCANFALVNLYLHRKRLAVLGQ